MATDAYQKMKKLCTRMFSRKNTMQFTPAAIACWAGCINSPASVAQEIQFRVSVRRRLGVGVGAGTGAEVFIQNTLPGFFYATAVHRTASDTFRVNKSRVFLRQRWYTSIH